MKEYATFLLLDCYLNQCSCFCDISKQQLLTWKNGNKSCFVIQASKIGDVRNGGHDVRPCSDGDMFDASTTTSTSRPMSQDSSSLWDTSSDMAAEVRRRNLRPQVLIILFESSDDPTA